MSQCFLMCIYTKRHDLVSHLLEKHTHAHTVNGGGGEKTKKEERYKRIINIVSVI